MPQVSRQVGTATSMEALAAIRARGGEPQNCLLTISGNGMASEEHLLGLTPAPRKDPCAHVHALRLLCCESACIIVSCHVLACVCLSWAAIPRVGVGTALGRQGGLPGTWGRVTWAPDLSLARAPAVCWLGAAVTLVDEELTGTLCSSHSGHRPQT